MEQAEADLSVMRQGDRLYKKHGTSMKYLLVVQLYGNLSITTATSEINETVESMSRFLTTNRNIELLGWGGGPSRTFLSGRKGQ